MKPGFCAWPKERLSPAECLQVMLVDPQLCWNIPRFFAEAKLPLPDFPWPTPVLKAYQFCSDAQYRDDNLRWAYELQQPEWWQVRDLVRPLLLCTDSTNDSISQSVHFPPEVISDFEALWWNVRDRRGDLLYLAQLLDGQRSEVGRQLMRVACLTNNSKLVLMAAGGQTDLSDKELRQQIEQWLVTEGELGQQLGLMSKKQNPALALLEQYLLGCQKPFKWDPAIYISLDKSMQAVVQQMAQDHMRDLLEASAQLATEQSNKPSPTSEGLSSPGPAVPP